VCALFLQALTVLKPRTLLRSLEVNQVTASKWRLGFVTHRMDRLGAPRILAIHLAFDQFQFDDLPFGLPV